MSRFFALVAGSLCLATAVAVGCNSSGSGDVGDGGSGDDSGIGNGGGGTGGTGTGGTGTGGTGTGGKGGIGTGGTGGIAAAAGCNVSNPLCSDGKDNDGDGKIDSADPECVGVCDNDEGSFATGIPGDNIDACKQDCFFDGNSGMGDDGCEWNLKCDKADPGSHAAKPCPYDDKFKNCPTTQSDKCVNNCRKLTPNGCDCFGCCAVPTNNTTVSVLLVAGCTAKDFGNTAVCPRCTPNTACINTCEKCEVCIGKPAPDPSCPAAPPTGGQDGGAGGAGGSGGKDGGAGGSGGSDGGSTPPPPPAIVCEGGAVSCGTGGQVTQCPSGTYCITGCCIKVIE